MNSNKNLAEGSIQQPETLVIIVDIEEYFHRNERHPEHDPGVVISYKIKVDDQYYIVPEKHLSDAAIIGLTGKDPQLFDLEQIIKEDGEIKTIGIHPGTSVDFSKPGIERFITVPKTYPFFIERKEYFSPSQELTVRQILVDFAKVSPETKSLAKKIPGGVYTYTNLDEKVVLKDCPHFTLFDNTSTNVS